MNRNKTSKKSNPISAINRLKSGLFKNGIIKYYYFLMSTNSTSNTNVA